MVGLWHLNVAKATRLRWLVAAMICGKDIATNNGVAICNFVDMTKRNDSGQVTRLGDLYHAWSQHDSPAACIVLRGAGKVTQGY